jgi:Asp-tRNA(Asn)/Glu-tRNA(Gln) amidotransferase A subunit family amidase
MELAGMLRRGEISAREITQSVFKRVDEREKAINAFEDPSMFSCWENLCASSYGLQ